MKNWYVIPARSGSKGLPGKNRILFDYTAEKIPKKIRDRVIVTTDDSEICKAAETYGFVVQKRSKKNSSDLASTRDVLLEVSKEMNMEDDDNITLLYLTYPSRRWSDVLRAHKTFREENSSSLLCKKKIEVTPYLMFFEVEGNRGKKVIDHDLCRRQDYKPCFEMSHYVGVFRVGDLSSLDTNLWRHDTIFMEISNEVDVDYKEDLDDFLEGK